MKDIASLTTLAGYVHEQLSGEHILGVGDASGMFPLTADGAYDKEKLSQFSVLVHDKGHSWQLEELLPAIRMAGESAGQLTAEGAKKLDPSGHLQAGALMAPPEGDAGTGMVSTNAAVQIECGFGLIQFGILQRTFVETFRLRAVDLIERGRRDAEAIAA